MIFDLFVLEPSFILGLVFPIQWLFRFKHACFEFSQFLFLVELVVAKFDRSVLVFLPMCVWSGLNSVIPCGAIQSVLIILVLFLSFFFTPGSALMFESFVLLLLLIYGRLLVRTKILCCLN